MYKKIIAGIVAITMMFGTAAVVGNTGVNNVLSVISASAAATYGEYNGWKYVVNGDWLCVYEYGGSETEVTLPGNIDGKTVIYDGDAFDGDDWYGNGSIFGMNNTVKTVNIPEDVTDINDTLLFAGKTVTAINVASNNPKFASKDGLLYSKDMTQLLDCPEGKSGEIVIPDGTKYIGADSSDYSSDFGLGAFEDCQEITSIKLSDSVIEVSYRAFRYCKSLRTVDLANAVIEGADPFAFSVCDSLESINVSDSSAELASVDGVLYTKDMTACIMIPARKKSVTIPASIENIWFIDYGSELIDGEYVDTSRYINYYDYRLWCTEINVEEGNNTFASVDGTLYTKDMKNLIYYPMGVENAVVADGTEIISYGAFFNHTDLKSVTLPDSIRSINDYAFLNCTELKSITLPDLSNDTNSWGEHVIGRYALGYYYNDPLSSSVRYINPNKVENFIIFCNEGTDGERYAEENGFAHYLPGTEVEIPEEDNSNTENDSTNNENTVDNTRNDSTANSDNTKIDDGSDDSNATNPKTGATASLAFAGIALAGMAVIVSKKNK